MLDTVSKAVSRAHVRCEQSAPVQPARCRGGGDRMGAQRGAGVRKIKVEAVAEDQAPQRKPQNRMPVAWVDQPHPQLATSVQPTLSPRLSALRYACMRGQTTKRVGGWGLGPAQVCGGRAGHGKKHGWLAWPAEIRDSLNAPDPKGCRSAGSTRTCRWQSSGRGRSTGWGTPRMRRPPWRGAGGPRPGKGSGTQQKR